MKEKVSKLVAGMDAFVRGLTLVTGMALGAMILILFVQVIMRVVFQSPIFGLDELVILLMVWTMALGCATVYWGNEHAVIEALFKHFPKGVQRALYHIINLIVLITSLVYIPGAITLFGMQVGMRPVGGLPFSRAWYYPLPIIVMGILLVVFALVKTVAYAAIGDEDIVGITDEDGGITLD